MNSGRISDCLEKLRSEGRKGLIPFITAGDPDLAGTIELARGLARAGADIIELGVPFSDPLADGPVIQQASGRALAAGTTLPGILEVVREMKNNCSIPVVLMGYYNPFYKYGLRQLARDAAEAGVDGLIVPDLPCEEAGLLDEAALAQGIDLIYLVAPTTTGPRLEQIASRARGFIYCVSVTGVTGAREELNTDLGEFTGRVRRCTSLPLAVGFGIAGPEQAARVAGYCDAVVVGSALVKIIARYGTAAAALPEVTQLAGRIREALDAGRPGAALQT